ncbi:hypothetical protein ID866_706 [Astraeus odoratus]|nr:hypothetical protein ID866_706 [Astraeus odoratus]
MSQVLITGATGLVGGHLLRLLIQDRHINYIAAPTRRPLLDITGVYNPHDPQLTDALAQVQDPIDIAFCCLGTTRREAGSKEAFVHADYTLVVDTALTVKKLGAKHFLVVKGKMEEALIAQKWERLTIVRPSMLMGHRDERRFNESFFAPLFRILPGNWKSIEARDVAQAMLKEALAPSQEGVNIIPSAKLREIAQGEA